MYNRFDLFFIDFYIDNKRIGIEGVFVVSEKSIFGKFRYCVTSWDADARQYIENVLLSKLENKFGKVENTEKPTNKRIHLVYSVDLSGLDNEEDNEKIIDLLGKLYSFLKSMT